MTGHPGMLVGRIDNPGGTKQWLRFALPLPAGQFPGHALPSVYSPDGGLLHIDMKPLRNWPDHSAQWLLVDAVTDRTCRLFLRDQTGQAGVQASATSALDGAVFVDDENPSRVHVGEALVIEPRLMIGSRWRPLALASQSVESGSLASCYRLLFEVGGQADLLIRLELMQVPLANQSRCTLTVHNRAASRHPGGCWDLGDPNSIDIDRLALCIQCTQAMGTRLTVVEDAEEGLAQPVTLETGELHQFGSGGPNWQSPVHVDREGGVAVHERGFRLDGGPETETVQGLRARPGVSFQTGESDTLTLTPHRFWQNFPASLVVEPGQAEWVLFSARTELQPGESKTWCCDLGPAQPEACFVHEPGWVDGTRVLPGYQVSVDNELSRLLGSGVDGPDSFFDKREACDEYGWRHFGELYADHEALNQPGDGIFVSHYNNQYDPIWGFSHRHLATGDPRWSELATDLARHVVDIDIYRTDRDKAEYNNGLFWHTDHYLPALTATHRTYSRHHSYAYEGHQGGGGPGGQHCYTSGLALRYLLTGEPVYRQTVLGLLDWIRCFYNGAPGVLARLHRLASVDLKNGQLTNIGFIEKGFKYPLDRGTGNYLNALIDACLVSGDASLTGEMHAVVQQTVSPQDDPGARQLADAENHWFYIVFLQALARYLVLKEQLQQDDARYAYARHCYNHYADWVLKNEQPYLDHPEALEFPTDTWAAQDIRKANVLYYAAYFAPDRAEEFLERAEAFWQYCVSVLTRSPERHTTRIRAIVAQNLGVREWVLENHITPYPLTDLEPGTLRRPGTAGLFLRDLGRALPGFSLTQEVRWMKSRLTGRGQ